MTAAPPLASSLLEELRERGGERDLTSHEASSASYGVGWVGTSGLDSGVGPGYRRHDTAHTFVVCLVQRPALGYNGRAWLARLF